MENKNKLGYAFVVFVVLSCVLGSGVWGDDCGTSVVTTDTGGGVSAGGGDTGGIIVKTIPLNTIVSYALTLKLQELDYKDGDIITSENGGQFKIVDNKWIKVDGTITNDDLKSLNNINNYGEDKIFTIKTTDETSRVIVTQTKLDKQEQPDKTTEEIKTFQQNWINTNCPKGICPKGVECIGTTKKEDGKCVADGILGAKTQVAMDTKKTETSQNGNSDEGTPQLKKEETTLTFAEKAKAEVKKSEPTESLGSYLNKIASEELTDTYIKDIEKQIETKQNKLESEKNTETKKQLEKEIKELELKIDRDALVGEVCKNSEEKCAIALVKSGNSKTLETLINRKKIALNSNDLAGIFSSVNLNEKQTQEMMQAVMGYGCDGALASAWCSLLGRATESDLFLKGVDATIDKAQDANMKVKEDKEVVINDKPVCKAGTTVTDCQNAIKKQCGDNKKCIESALTQLEMVSVLDTDNLNEYNQNLVESYLNTNLKGVLTTKDDTTKIEEECANGYTESCDTAINDLAVCSGENSDAFKCKNIKDGMKQVAARQTVEVGAGYLLMQSLLHPDQDALNAMSLFGFEADYSNLPQFLGESMPSTICLAKIDGYLDKESDNNGGVTQYKDCDEYDATGNPSSHCRDVKGDLRAQRTTITPDAKVAISYSYYLDAPEDEDLNYIVAISYKQNGVTKKEAVEVNKTIEKDDTVKEFENIEFPLETIEGIDKDSFKIALAAFYDNREVYIKLVAPIIMATPEAYTEVLEEGGNSQGNSMGEMQSEEEDEFGTQEMLSMINFG